MAYEHRELSGSAWSERKYSDKAPDYKGEVLIGGHLYGLALWKRTTKSNREYLSVQLSTPDVNAERKRKEAEYRASKAGIPTAAPTPPASVPMPDPERNRQEPELPGSEERTINIPF